MRFFAGPSSLSALSALAAVLSFARPAFATDGRFDAKTLATDGDILDVAPADLDGDGKKDLLAFYKRGVEPRETRHFALFWNRNGNFFERPDEVIAVSADACIFDVAELDDIAGEELIFVGPNGVTARTFRGRKVGPLETVVSSPTLFAQADAGTLPRLRLVHAVAGEGTRELLVFAPRALDIFRRAAGGAGYERAARLEVALESEISKPRTRARRTSENIPSISMTLRFPAIAVVDTNADQLRDLVLSIEDRVAIYRQAEGMKFAARPTWTRDFAVRSVEDRKEAYSWVGVSVVDLDLDGAADLLVRKNVAHGIASAQATSYLFLAGKGGAYPTRPDQTLTSEGAAGPEIELFDITGDGRADLIVPSISIGVMTVIRFLTSRSLEVDTQVFSFDGKTRRFSDHPIAERELDFDLSLEGEADTQAFDMVGDYDGDGRPDLAFATGEGELSIYRGLGEGSLFAEDATETIAVRSYGQLLSVDLDAQGRSDLIMYYPRTNGRRGELVVIKNRTRRS